MAVPAFGKFKATEGAARLGRNPATGETIQITALRKAAFAPLKQINDKLNTSKD